MSEEYDDEVEEELEILIRKQKEKKQDEALRLARIEEEKKNASGNKNSEGK